jgi:tRNA-dihydrouridine synthase B
VFYGEVPGIRIARKHIGWYLNVFEQGRMFRSQFNQLNCARSQEDALLAFFASGATLKQYQCGINKEEKAA